MKKIVAVLLAVLMVFSLAACRKDSSDGGKKTVFVVIKGLGNAYWAVLQAGATKAGEDFGCNVIVQGIPNESDVEIQTNMLQQAVAARADAIVFAPADAKAQANAASEAFQFGIPIILVDTKLEGTNNYSASIVTDNVQAGKDAAAEMIKKLALRNKDTDSIEVAIQRAALGNKSVDDRIAGFREYWDANAPSQWVVLWNDVRINEGQADLYMKFGGEFISAYPKLKGFFSPNNGSTVGFASTIKDQTRTDFTLVGFDFSPEIVGLIANPSFNVSTMLQKQYSMGYDGVRIALELANGGKVEQKDISIGAMVVDSTNVTSAEVMDAVGPPYAETMEKI